MMAITAVQIQIKEIQNEYFAKRLQSKLTVSIAPKSF